MGSLSTTFKQKSKAWHDLAWLEECLTPLWGHLDSNAIQKWLTVVTLI